MSNAAKQIDNPVITSFWTTRVSFVGPAVRAAVSCKRLSDKTISLLNLCHDIAG